MSPPHPEVLRQWEEEGCLVLENAIAGSELARVQRAFARCAAGAKAEWLAGVAAGTRPAAFFDIPDPLEKDECFVDLVDHPVYYELLLEFTAGELIFIGPQFRTLPPSPLSYVGWHFDVPRTNPLHLKVQIYLDEVGPEAGPFAYVPGSHKAGAGPREPVRRLESMPGHRVFPGSAGTALLFNSYGLHTAMANRTRKARRSIILIYEKRTSRDLDPSRFEGIAARTRGIEHKLNTPQRRRLFGLD